MIELSRKGDYAIRGMLYLARQEEGAVSLIKDIAKAVKVPQSFLAKIFQDFNKIGLVKSTRGAGGGFSLGKPAKDISLFDIVTAIEGPIKPNRCIMDEDDCSFKKTCSVHPVWLKMRDNIEAQLKGVTLKDLI
ncbi:MAG TPA: Rrf2 family transcriptional regulator [Spirochaetota bacterium]|mgnify:FL=1|jgi:Rrf2 family protein|nr:Rrf2 family transcriptional regulator [Spirochaetota bacterium]HPV39687.1 Rrf2 family transcriptional regulator [Spirochaetota bacterium]